MAWYHQIKFETAARKLLDSLTLYPTGETTVRAYVGTLTSTATKNNSFEDFQNAYAAWCAWAELLLTGSNDKTQERQLAIESDVFAQKFPFVAQGRRLCKTKKGYLGLVPEDAREGDIFFIPRGSPLPFLLRRSGHVFILKDVCYVHGMTHDWAYGESGCPEEEILLA